MRNYQKILVVVSVVAVAVVIGGVIGWMGGRGWENENASTPISPMPQITAPTVNPPTVLRPPPVPVASPNVQPAEVKPATADTNWEDALDAILNADSDDAEKVKRLFALFPHLPKDGQVAVAENLADLVPDANYAPLGDLLKDATLPADVLDVLMADALSRPDSLKLPLMLDLAQNPDHAKAADAKDILETYLGEDYGSDWQQWRQKMEAWLKENPD